MGSKQRIGQLTAFSPFNVVAKTADYTVTTKDMGNIFTTRGAATSVTFALPAPTVVGKGANVTFFNIANLDMAVSTSATGSTTTMVGWNTSTANRVAVMLADARIGGGFVCICDGTQWYASPLLSKSSQGMGASCTS
jgi:hypothetical protein